MERIRCVKLVRGLTVVFLLLLLLVHGNAKMTIRCPEREREALLALKQGFEGDSKKLSSWGGEPGKQDCCTWEGVHCSNQTGHVIKLDPGLGVEYMQGKMIISPKLIELRQLEYLDLKGLYFNGSQIPDFIGSLTNLRFLDLSWSSFGGKFPSQVGNLTHLQYLDLSANDFTNVENLNWLPRLSSLTYLDLSFTNLSYVFNWPEAVNQLPKLRNLTLQGCDLSSPSPILSTLSNINSSRFLASVDLPMNFFSSPSIFFWLSNFNTSLLHLDLSYSLLTGSIPNVFGNMNSLTELDLSVNQLEGGGSHSFARLCSLQSLRLSENNLSGQVSKFVKVLSTCAQNSLESLDLYWNNLEGSLPNLTNFSSLKELLLGHNRLSGAIPESIGQMPKLETISFGMNSFEGVISETHFSKLSKLRALDLSSNSLVVNFHSDWVPPFHLGSIDLRSCKVGPDFPKWLQTQKGFSYLDISDAGISDILPSWFWGLCHNLTFMNVSSNEIRGTFGNSMLGFAYYPEIHMRSNQLEGPIPSILSNASYLDLSDNKIAGSISFLCASATMSLSFLNLSINNVSGEIPDCLTHLENLAMLDLSHNAFYGEIPPTIGALYGMETLKLRSNRFEAEIPSSMKNCTSLQVIDLGDNKISGSIPEWLGESLPNLMILMLQSNQLSGRMPSQLCHLARIQILDFSKNNISGSIPKCLNNLTALAQTGNSSMNISHYYEIETQKGSFTSADYEDDATFIWKGRMYRYKNTLGLVKRIDLSSNRLTGEIPSEITDLVGLDSLNLSRNGLTGEITPDIGNLQSLDALDLSRNQIDGRIPTSLARVDRLSFLDLSYNNLSGKIPIGTQLQGFDPSVYEGNAQLCGLPLEKTCASEETAGPKQTVLSDNEGEEEADDLVTLGFYLSLGFGFVVGFWGAFGSLIFNKSWRYKFFKFFNV